MITNNLLALEAFFEGYVEVFSNKNVNVRELLEGELLEPFKDPTSINYSNLTIAVKNELHRVIQWFLDERPSLINDLSTKQQERLCSNAIQYGSLRVVRELIESGVEINHVFVGCAILHDQPTILSLLLEHSNEISEFDLIQAVEQQRTKCVEVILNELLENDVIDIDFHSLLLTSVELNDIDTVKILLKYGASTKYSESDDTIALMIAVQDGYYEIAKLLLEYKANVHTLNDQPIIEAAINGDDKMIKLLLDYGANVNAGDGAALIYSAQQNYIRCVELLLERGANPRMQNDRALYKAIQNQHRDVVGTLLQHYSQCPLCLKKSM